MTTTTALQQRTFLFINREVNNNQQVNENPENSALINEKIFDEVLLSVGGESGFNKYVEEMEAGQQGVVGAFFNSIGTVIDDIINVISTNDNTDNDEDNIDYDAEIEKLSKELENLTKEAQELSEQIAAACDAGDEEKAKQIREKYWQVTDKLADVGYEYQMLRLDKTAKEYPELADLIKEVKQSWKENKELIQQRRELSRSYDKDRDNLIQQIYAAKEAGDKALVDKLYAQLYKLDEEFTKNLDNLNSKQDSIIEKRIATEKLVDKSIDNIRFQKLDKEIEQAQKAGDTAKAAKLMERKQKIQTIDNQIAALERNFVILDAKALDIQTQMDVAADEFNTKVNADNFDRSKYEEVKAEFDLKIKDLQNQEKQIFKEKQAVSEKICELSAKRVALFNGEDVEVEETKETSTTGVVTIGGYTGITSISTVSDAINSSIAFLQQKYSRLTNELLKLADQADDAADQYNLVRNSTNDKTKIEQAKAKYERTISSIQRREKSIYAERARIQQQIAKLTQQKEDMEFDAKIQELAEKKAQAEKAGDTTKAEQITKEMKEAYEEKLDEIKKKIAKLEKDSEDLAKSYRKQMSEANGDKTRQTEITKQYETMMQTMQNEEKALYAKYETIQMSLSQLG